MRTSTTLLACALLAPFAIAQDPDAPPDSDARCRALCERADRGELTVPDVLAALVGSDEAVARTAAAIVRHEWVELPRELLEGMDGQPRAARRFLGELVRAPRPAAAAWVREQAGEMLGRSVDHRLLAIAARGTAPTKEEAQLLLAAAQEERVGDGFYYAAERLPEKVADGLLGRVHQLLLGGDAPFAHVAPLLDRLSPRGTKSLLGLAVTLEPELARELVRHVRQNRPALVDERVDAALDGRVPLDKVWLEVAGKRIDRPERVARVLAVIADDDAAEATRDLAFDALLTAGAVDAAVLAVAIPDDADTERIRRAIRKAFEHVPDARVVAWLQNEPEVVHDTARALTRRTALAPEVEEQLLRLLDGFEVVDRETPLWALTAVAHAGSAEGLRRVWPLVLGSPAWKDLLEQLGRREDPFVYEQLLATMVDPPADLDPARLDMCRLLLVARGDRRELDTLVANAPKRDALFVRRCQHYAPKLTAAHADALYDAALACEDPDVAAELLEWVVDAEPADVVEKLWPLWNDPPDAPAIDELRETALRLLVKSGRRDELAEQFRRAVAAGPLGDDLSSLPYELLNGMAEPLDAADLTLAADIVLRTPLRDEEGERRRARRWPDGSFGFPLVAATANRLRAADPLLAEEVFGRVVEQVEGDPGAAFVSHQRLKIFWRALATRPGLQRALGGVTARLWRFEAAPAAKGIGDDDVDAGAAHWLIAQRFEARGAFGNARDHYVAAARRLLRLPSARAEARWLLGDRDPAGGRDAWAALAAAPHRMTLELAAMRDDPDAIAAAARMVREFAGNDRATLAAAAARHPDPDKDPGR